MHGKQYFKKYFYTVSFKKERLIYFINFGQKLEYATLVDVTRADTGRVPQNGPSRFLPNPTQFT